MSGLCASVNLWQKLYIKGGNRDAYTSIHLFLQAHIRIHSATFSINLHHSFYIQSKDAHKAEILHVYQQHSFDFKWRCNSMPACHFHSPWERISALKQHLPWPKCHVAWNLEEKWSKLASSKFPCHCCTHSAVQSMHTFWLRALDSRLGWFPRKQQPMFESFWKKAGWAFPLCMRQR